MKEKHIRGVWANVIIIATLSILLAVTAGSSAVIGVRATADDVIYNGNKDSNKISLMFNVYTGTEYVLPIAELLSAYGYSATFFVGGCWADDNADIVRQLDKLGMEIGNHGYFHRDHENLTYAQNHDEIIMNERLLTEILGRAPRRLFAPPSGSIGVEMLKVCEDNAYSVIMWTRDTVDWRDKDADIVYKRAVKNMSGGDLILMHPSAHTFDALSNVLNYCKDNGLRAVSVSENLSPDF